jgi:hypothetical protein
MPDFASSPERAKGRKMIAALAGLYEALEHDAFEDVQSRIQSSPDYELVSLVNRYDMDFMRNASFSERAIVKSLLRRSVIDAFPEFSPTPVLRSEFFGPAQFETFKKQGVVSIGEYINQEQRNDILRYLHDHPVYNAHIAGCGDQKPRYIDDPADPADVYQFGAYAEEAIAAMPHVARIALNPDALDLLQNYFGVPPVLLDLHLWWSFPKPGKHGPQPFAGQGFHRDFRSLQDVQFFTCLSDLQDDDGAHEYFAGTHDDRVFVEQLNRCDRLKELPPSEALNRVFFPVGDGYGRYPGDVDQDEDWTVTLGPTLIRIPMRAGHSFMVDTMGLHRGVPPVRQRRLVFSARFTATGGETAIAERRRSGGSLKSAAESRVEYTLSYFKQKMGNDVASALARDLDG